MGRTQTAAPTPKEIAAVRTRPAPKPTPVVRPSPPRTRAKSVKAPATPTPKAPIARASVPTSVPVPTPAPQRETGSKLAQIVALLCRPEGATIPELMHLTGWLSHSVRGALSGALKRKRGLPVVSRSEPSRGRVYRIAEIADLAEAAQLIPPVSGPVPSPAKVRRAKQSSSAVAAAA